ncbi:MAG: GntR family transcriptional regulator, partial [Oscillospiraceae bacterium]
MQEKQLVRERIHRDFLIRLCEGEFPRGSAMPSLPELCAQYGVGKNTILKVLQLLKAEDFIATSPGKASEVLFDCDHPEAYLADLPGFVCDKALLPDYYYAIRLLFPTICAHASLSCGAEELARIRELARRAHSADEKAYIRLSIQFFRASLAAMDNQLLKKIVEITLQETMIPGMLLCGHHAIFEAPLRQVSHQMEAYDRALQQKDVQQLHLCWEQFLTLYQLVLEQALTLGIFPDSPSVKDTRLFAQIDGEKRFILAFSLLEKILSGIYAPGDFLPSIAEAKQAFGVSAITVRSAYEILGEMGFAQTANGRGTRVLPFFTPRQSPLLERAA